MKLKTKSIVITGATSGIGKVTATRLAERGHQLIFVSRNKDKANQLAEQISSQDHLKPTIYIADFSEMNQVKEAALQIRQDFKKIDILINNAGLVNIKKIVTKDGFEHTLAVNHLAPYLLTHTLLDLIQSAEQGRIINVASNAHKYANPDLNDLNYQHRSFQPMYAYCNTKLYNIWYTYKLAEKLKNTSTTVNSCHPGFVASSFGHNMGKGAKVIMKLLRPIMISAEKGAQTTIFLATEPGLLQTSGEYFVRKKTRVPSSLARNESLADRLYQKTEALLKPFLD